MTRFSNDPRCGVFPVICPGGESGVDLTDALALVEQHAHGRRAFAIEGTGSFGAGLTRLLRGCGERVLVAAAVCRDRCFKHDRASDDLNHRECVRITMRIDTDDVVQLICKHPFLTSSPSVGWTQPVSVWGGTAGGRTVTGHALKTRTGF